MAEDPGGIAVVQWLEGQIKNEHYLLSRGGGSRETLAFLEQERAAAIAQAVAGRDEHEPFYRDKETGEPCPRRGNTLCDLPYDPAHRHVAVAGRDEGEAVERAAYLLWQINEGYLTDEDRAVGENWMLGDPARMHPDDRESLPGWLDAGRHVLSILATAGPAGADEGLPDECRRAYWCRRAWGSEGHTHPDEGLRARVEALAITDLKAAADRLEIECDANTPNPSPEREAERVLIRAARAVLAQPDTGAQPSPPRLTTDRNEGG